MRTLSDYRNIKTINNYGSVDNLRIKLKRFGITLREIADATDQSESTVCRMLNESLRTKIVSAAETLIEKRKEEINSG